MREEQNCNPQNKPRGSQFFFYGETMKSFKSFFKTTILFLAVFLCFFSCSKTTDSTQKNIAVFVPGIIVDSPVYKMLVDGVQKAADEVGNIKVTISEAGTSQAEWENKLTDLVASQQFDLIVSANPSIPSLAVEISKQFPNQKFLLLNGTLSPTQSNITTVQYNQREQAYMAGFLAALLSKEKIENSQGNHKIAIIAAQEYPDMNNIILPGFKEGAKDADPECKVEFRIVGNWYDATKSSDIASSLYRDGVDVILPIAGGANQGVLSAAQDLGFYVMWFDDSGYERAPGFIAGSSIMKQDLLAYNQVLAWIKSTEVKNENKTENSFFGKAKLVGVKEGYVDFDDSNPLYIKTVPSNIREIQAEMLKALRSGEKILLTNK